MIREISTDIIFLKTERNTFGYSIRVYAHIGIGAISAVRRVCRQFSNLHSKVRYESERGANRPRRGEVDWGAGAGGRTRTYEKAGGALGVGGVGGVGGKHAVSRDPLISCANKPAATLTSSAAALA
ncbi:unnamed protein product, partial [Iphiclides podalirius]